ncbi:hypothetical protein WME76_47990 (plasmid) [Sorangium sp. So ce119]|uniref:hypothetical protein n=1 Tax=Sorangium sp. So ce119 TaxID=3133279 RepID=UPI003F5EF344
MVAIDWHTPPCNDDISVSDFAADIETPLATLPVDGEDVPIYAQGGGAPLDAEAHCALSLGSSADIPENLKCTGEPLSRHAPSAPRQDPAVCFDATTCQ